jgi:hypothetical protein
MPAGFSRKPDLVLPAPLSPVVFGLKTIALAVAAIGAAWSIGLFRLPPFVVSAGQTVCPDFVHSTGKPCG